MWSAVETGVMAGVIPGSVGAALVEGEQRLRYSEVIRPRRHAELLLEAVLNVDRTSLYLRACESFGKAESDRFGSLLRRREAGEPVQYIVGWAPFFGRRFQVGRGVFIPRFETEVLVERFLKVFAEDEAVVRHVEVLDLCCGCGVIGLTVAAEVEHARVTLIDVSDTALEFCRHNSRALGVDGCVNIVRMNALDEFPDEWHSRFHYVLGNPPYVPRGEIEGLPRDVRDGEPHEALTDEDDGLTFYRRWVETVPPLLAPGGRFFAECGDGSAGSVRELLEGGFIDLNTVEDLDGMERVVEGRV